MVVRLDPWQEIVNVGWPTAPTHLAFFLRVSRDGTVEIDASCDAESERLPPPEGPTHDAYQSEIHYKYMVPENGEVAGVYQRRNDVWLGSSAVEGSPISISTLPSLPSFNFGYFEHVGGGRGVNGYVVGGGSVRWTPPSGAELDVKVPNSADSFLAATDAVLDIFGDTFTGDPACHSLWHNPSHKWADCTGRLAGSGVSSYVQYAANHGFSVAELTATYAAGETPVNYVPLGVRLLGGQDLHGGKNADAMLWVLLVREDLAPDEDDEE